MSNINDKRIAKNTMILYFRLGITMLVALYTSRIVLSALGIEDYGIYNVVGGVIALFSFLNGALGAATSRFITFELGQNNLSRLVDIFRSSYTVHLLLAVIVVILAETLGLWFVNYKLVIPESRIFAANVIYQFTVLSCAITIIQVPLNAEIIAHEKMEFYAYIGLVDVFLRLLIAFILCQFVGNKLILYGTLLLGVTIILFICYYIYCKKKFVECKMSILLHKNILLGMLSYSGWSLLGSAAYVLKDQGVNMLLNIFFGPVINAARGIAYQVNTAISSFAQNFTLALNPQIIKSYATDDLERTKSLLFRGSKFSCYLMLFFSIPIFVETQYVLTVWLTTVPEYTVIFTRLVIINSILESFTYTIGTTVQATGRIKYYQILVGGILLLNLPVSYLLLNIGYPPYITLIVSIVFTLLSLLIRALVLNTLIHISVFVYLFKVVLMTLTIGSIGMLPSLVITLLMDEGFLRLLVVVSMSFLCIGISIWFLGLDLEEKKLIKPFVVKQVRRLVASIRF